MENESASYRVCEWIIAAQNRFKNMYDAGIDLQGYPEIQKAIKHLQETGKLTVGQTQYVFNRTDESGSVSKYNTYKGYNKKYGEMLPCSVKDLVDSGLVDWASGRHCMQSAFAKAIAKETNYQWVNGQLKRKPSQIVQGLFV